MHQALFCASWGMGAPIEIRSYASKTRNFSTYAIEIIIKNPE